MFLKCCDLVVFVCVLYVFVDLANLGPLEGHGCLNSKIETGAYKQGPPLGAGKRQEKGRKEAGKRQDRGRKEAEQNRREAEQLQEHANV